MPGAAYDPATGRLNLVGTETQVGCDGFPCDGPYDFFTGRGDLRLSEPFVPPEVPALGPPAAALLAAGARAARSARTPDPG